MPIKEGARQVAIEPDVVAKLENYRKSGLTKAPDFKALVNELLNASVEKETGFLQFYAPYLSKVGYHDDTLYIKDAKKGMTAEVSLKDKSLFCNLDGANSCVHVHFALAIPEIANLHLKSPEEDQ
jgi:hypothetical protein